MHALPGVEGGMEGRGQAGEGAAVITIVISNGQTGSGATVEDACEELVDPRLLPVSVKVGRGQFVPASDATPDDVLLHRALWYKKAGSWHVAALVDEVTEGATT
jgi:hypothetical protein